MNKFKLALVGVVFCAFVLLPVGSAFAVDNIPGTYWELDSGEWGPVSLDGDDDANNHAVYVERLGQGDEVEVFSRLMAG